MKNKIKIAIAGMGGIGGYIGGKLAHYYSNSDNVSVTFICRGEHYEAIKTNGLELRSLGQLMNCRPHLVSYNASEIGVLDILIICTKSYGLEALLKAYAECISRETVIITTQNTVNGKETILRQLSSSTTILEGIIYISSNIIQPGIIDHVSGPSKLLFGTNGPADIDGAAIVKLFTDAGIDASFTTSINTILWKKFMFVSPAAIVTALYQISFSDIMRREDATDLYVRLVSEVIQLARAQQIDVDENTIANNCKLLSNFGLSVKSSFQLDLENNKSTEFNSLVQYVIDKSKEFGLKATYYQQSANQLFERYKLY